MKFPALSRSGLTVVGVALAVAIVGVIVAPWPTPVPEVMLDLFDSDLLTTDARGFLPESGRIDITPQELVLTTKTRSQPTVHILTTAVPFTAAFSVSVVRRAGDVFPFRVKVWNPRAEVAAEAWYAPDGSIMAGVRVLDDWLDVRRIGAYAVGDTLQWSIASAEHRVELRVLGHDGSGAYGVERNRFPALFQQETLSMTVFATAAGAGSAATLIRDPAITVPGQRRYGTTVQSRIFRPVVGVVAALALAWVVASIRLPRRPLNWTGRDLILALSLSTLALIAGWFLSRTPGHPFDMRNATLWSRIAAEHGPDAIVARSLLATEGHAHGGPPYAAVTYPYPPLLTNVFWIAGRISSPPRLAQTIKMISVLAVVAGGVILFFLLRHLGVGPSGAALAMGAYALNPAILLDAAVWGQTDAFVAAFLMLAVAGVAARSAPLLWTGAILAVLSKQTGGLLALIIILLAIARLDVRQNAVGLLAAVAIAFLVLAPGFLSGIHPSAVYRPVLAAVQAFGSGARVDTGNAVVSQSAFTFWSTATALEGARGWQRMAFPDQIPSWIGLSYFTLSRLAFGLFMLMLAIFVYRKRSSGTAFLMTIIAGYAVGAVFLLTRVSPRYFFFALMFACAAWPWLPRAIGAFTVTTLTVTMTVSILGLLVSTSFWYPGLLPAFEPGRWQLTDSVAALVGSDAVITLGGLLNLGVLVALVHSAWKAQ